MASGDALAPFLVSRYSPKPALLQQVLANGWLSRPKPS
jgi:hypothetical protein